MAGRRTAFTWPWLARAAATRRKADPEPGRAGPPLKKAAAEPRPAQEETQPGAEALQAVEHRWGRARRGRYAVGGSWGGIVGPRGRGRYRHAGRPRQHTGGARRGEGRREQARRRGPPSKGSAHKKRVRRQAAEPRKSPSPEEAREPSATATQPDEHNGGAAGGTAAENVRVC